MRHFCVLCIPAAGVVYHIIQAQGGMDAGAALGREGE